MIDGDQTLPRPSGAPDAQPVSTQTVTEELLENRPVNRLVFQVAGQLLLYDQRTAMEYFESQTLFRIPTRHPVFRGLINRRGSLVPVFDVGSLLGAEPSLSNRAKVLVLGTGDDAVGIMLDNTPHRTSISEEQKAPAPVQLFQVFGRHIGECFATESGCVADVDLGSFLEDLAHETN